MKTKPNHIDIESDDSPVFIEPRERIRIQIDMIREHQYLMSVEQGREVDECEAMMDWVEQGYAHKFAEKYRCQNCDKPS